MYSNTIPKVLTIALLGCAPALANPPYNPNEPPPPPTVPQHPTPSGVPSNGVCCGYELTNRGSVYFRYRHEIDFDKVGRSRFPHRRHSLILLVTKVDQLGQSLRGWMGNFPWLASRAVESVHWPTGDRQRKQHRVDSWSRSAIEGPS